MEKLQLRCPSSTVRLIKPLSFHFVVVFMENIGGSERYSCLFKTPIISISSFRSTFMLHLMTHVWGHNLKEQCVDNLKQQFTVPWFCNFKWFLRPYSSGLSISADGSKIRETYNRILQILWIAQYLALLFYLKNMTTVQREFLKPET
jgi:hypothetical protein